MAENDINLKDLDLNMEDLDFNNELQNLKKMSETIVATTQQNIKAPVNIVKADIQQNRRPKPALKAGANLQKKVRIQAPVPKTPNVSATSDGTSDDVEKIINTERSVNTNSIDSFAIMGLNVPKQTAYFAVFLILLAIVFWYMSRDKPKKKKRSNEEEEE